MSRRSDRFKKILPTDVPKRGLDIKVSTHVEATTKDPFPALREGSGRTPNFEVGAVQGDSPGAALPKLVSEKTAGIQERSARSWVAAKEAEKKRKPKKTKAPRKVKNTDFRVRLDFTIRVEGDDVIPEIFGPKYMDFIAAGLLGTMLKAPKYKNRNVDVLSGSRLHVSVKQHKED